MKKTLLLLLLVLMSFFKTNAQPTYSQSEYDKIQANIVKFLFGQTNVNSAKSASDNSLKDYKANGSWSDLVYINVDGSVNGGAFQTHLRRLYSFVVAYTMPGCTLYNDPGLYIKITNSFQFWFATNVDKKDWYADDIFYPTFIGQMLILMKVGPQQLATADYNTALNYMISRNLPVANDRGGSNATDMCIHWLYKGILRANQSDMQIAFDVAGQTLDKQTIGMAGINFDNCYILHGPQLMSQSYGPVLAEDIYKMSTFFKGTTFAFSAERMSTLYNYFHNTINANTRGKYYDFNLVGRSLSLKNGINSKLSITQLAMNVVDNVNTQELRKDSLRISGAKTPEYMVYSTHSHQWAGDFTFHNRPGYSFSVRSNSTRTARTESILGTINLLGSFLSEGATDIRINGDEYFNVFATWDWNLIPGITMLQFSPYKNNPTQCCSENRDVFNGNQSFVGGVSDGLYGVTASTMDYFGVTAKKAWFFFDNEIVNLGAGITSIEAEKVATAVNQCLLKSTVAVKSGTTISTLAAQSVNTYANNLKWVLQDKVGYFFPSNGNISISNKTQSGDWNTIAKSNAVGSIETKDVFKMFIDHGIKPTNASYAYIVVPNLANTAAADAYNTNDVTIISNTTSIQAVKHNVLKQLQAVVRTTGGGTVTDAATGFKINVNQPCVVMVKNIEADTVNVTLADPTQTLTTIVVKITFPGTTNEVPVTVTLPSARGYKGSSIDVMVSRSYPQCLATGGANGKDRYITRLTTTGGTSNINYTNSSYPLNGYNSHTADILSIDRRKSFVLNMINSANTKNSRIKVYIDWDGNNDFTSTGDEVLTLGAANRDNSSTVLNTTNTITIPSSAKLGNVKMRVRFFDAASTNLTPCGQADKTTTQDFNIKITLPESITAIADAYVRDGSYSNTNYGTSSELALKKDPANNGGYTRTAYLKFDLQDIPRPVKFAKLRLFLNGVGNTSDLANITVKSCTDDTWTETGIKWSNKPATGSQVAIAPGQKTRGYMEWDISDAINATTDNLLTLQLESTATGALTSFSFTTKENSNVLYRPTIKFDYTDIATSTIATIADAPVKSGYMANTNYGAYYILMAQKDLYESYLKFDLSTLPANARTAKLKLYNLDPTAAQLQLYRVNTNTWTEEGINWNNKPAENNLVATINIPASVGFVEWDIFNELTNNMPADKIVTFKIVETNNVYIRVRSKENLTVAQRPFIEFKAPAGTSTVKSSLEDINQPTINEADLNTNIINIFPNPTSNYITIVSDRSINSVSVYNMKGVRIKTINNINAIECQIDLQYLSKGLYLVNITGDGWSEQKRLVKN